MPPAVKSPTPSVAFVACEPAIVVPTGWRAADPSTRLADRREEAHECLNMTSTS
jgi:hypothetical protein